MMCIKTTLIYDIGVIYMCDIAMQQNIDDVSFQQHQQRAAAAVSLVSYDVDARMKMFGWLNR